MIQFEDVNSEKKRILFVVKQIVRSDSIRGLIVDAVRSNNRRETIKLFDESVRTYGFGGVEMDGVGCCSWGRGILRVSGESEEYKITATELADALLDDYWEGVE